jgi:hypothetical protein
MNDTFVPSSFIPKEPLNESGGVKKKKTRNRSLFYVISSLIFIISLLSAGGAFLYEKFVESRIASKQSELQEARAEFDPDLIESLSQTDKRLRVGGQLLNQHVMATPFFFILEDTTLKSVQFTDLHLERDGGTYSVLLRGVTSDYAGVALQADSFGGHSGIENPIFSEFDLTEEGDVLFTVSFSLDPEIVQYKSYIQE